MGHIQSVPYAVGLRWVFYRLLQDGILSDKSEYSKLKSCTSKARKSFWNSWEPSTLIDSGRSIIQSQTPEDRKTVLSELHLYVKIIPNLFQHQKSVPFLIFEAATMDGQFKHFAPWADRSAFRGDASIPHKWNIAKRCDALSYYYDKPITILYFGDYDRKGLLIPESAMDDIYEWVDLRTNLDFIRCGLNEGDAERFHLPEKSLKVGTYEWESLNSDDAGMLIQEGLSRVVDLNAIEQTIQDDKESKCLQEEVQLKLEELIAVRP